MDALEAIRTRRSIRKYKPDAVSKEVLKTLVDAGRLAPTARNEQPWEFVVVTEAERRKRLAALATHGKFIADAPACIVVLCKPSDYYLEDGSAATTQIMLAATALGLGTCWVAGDKKDYAPAVVKAVGAPPKYKLVSLISVGYAAETPAPAKRSVTDVLHWGTFS
jgi:nitroreductase